MGNFFECEFMVSDLVNIIMFKLYRVSKISHNWYMQMILIRFFQCYQSAFTFNHIFCHTCILYNMNIHNILHMICYMYYVEQYFDIDAFEKV